MNPQSSFAACRAEERNEAYVWKNLNKLREVLGGIDFNHNELANAGKTLKLGDSSSILMLLAERFFQACVPGERPGLQPTQIKLRRRKKCPCLPGMFPIQDLES